MYKDTPIRVIPNFSTEIPNARSIEQCLPYSKRPEMSSHSIMPSKTFNDKTKFKQYLSTNPALQEILGKSKNKNKMPKKKAKDRTQGCSLNHRKLRK